MGLLGQFRYFQCKFMYNKFNKTHHTRILSYDASLDARYGEHVWVEKTVEISSDVSIGKYTYVNPHSMLENCTVGNYCSISHGVNICPGEHLWRKLSQFLPPLHGLREEGNKRTQLPLGNG